MPRPTGRSHAPQNRLFSATSGFAITAEAGSLAGTGGMSTSPAPRWPRDDLVLPARVRRLPEPLPVRPLSVPVLPEPDEPEAEDGPEPAGAAGWAGIRGQPAGVAVPTVDRPAAARPHALDNSAGHGRLRSAQGEHRLLVAGHRGGRRGQVTRGGPEQFVGPSVPRVKIGVFGATQSRGSRR